MNASRADPAFASLADLFAIAYQIEADAVERYEMLTQQMESFNNPELVVIFRDLAKAEQIHRDEIRRLAGDADIEARARVVARWTHGESPEQVDLGAMHYLTTPWQALQLALEGEKRALAFFQRAAKDASDTEVKKVADAFADEEAEHVDLLHRLLRKYPKPTEFSTYDPDPPNPQD